MKTIETKLPGVVIIEPKVFADARGFFLESFAEQRYVEAGMNLPFIQDNHSRSSQGVLRGLHCQREYSQGKLVRVSKGAVLDVAVDCRVGSPTFGLWESVELNDENHRQLYIPPGYHHGFVVLSEVADFEYKCTDVYHPQAEVSVRWDDPDLAIDWQVAEPLVSQKDAEAPFLKDIAQELLPQYA